MSVSRVPQDVQIGYWLRSHPTLRYVSLPRKTGWADAFDEVSDLHRLLVAHRVPWSQISWLHSRTGRLWASAPEGPRAKVACGGELCPAGQCAHARGQLACAVELALPEIAAAAGSGAVLSAPNSSAGAGADAGAAAGPLQMGCGGCTCWEGAGAARRDSGGRCNFSRSWLPEPAHCSVAG